MDSIVLAISDEIDALSQFSVWLYELALYEIGYTSAYTNMVQIHLKTMLLDVNDEIVGFWFGYTDYLYTYIKVDKVITAYNAVYSSDSGYFLDFFQVSSFLSAYISASLIRFAIRRIPVIG